MLPAHGVRLLRLNPVRDREFRFPYGMAIALVLVVAAGLELRTSLVQSWILSWLAPRTTYILGPGTSGSVVFPSPDGPYDRRNGYSRIPEFEKRLEARGFRVTEQARFSPALSRLARRGVNPPYWEPSRTGLVLRTGNGQTVFDARPAHVAFQRYREIPEIVVRSLLFIENRELESQAPRLNPVFEWDRMAWAFLTYGAARAGLPVQVQGGSGLATQIEKFRHSPDGRTGSAGDKFRQILSASLKVYREDPYTLNDRQRIIVEYLNSVPLSGAPGFGEVLGLGEGLEAWFGVRLDETIADLSPPAPLETRAAALGRVLSLLCAVRAPTHYLVKSPASLANRVDFFASQLQEAGIIDAPLREAMRRTPMPPPGRHAGPVVRRPIASKAVAAVRVALMKQLEVQGLYELDRLDVMARATLDAELQRNTEDLLDQLGKMEFVREHGLAGEHLLSSGDPSEVLYSVLLYERTPLGNVLRVQADNLDSPLDLNDGMMLELGSTAKLRTLVHYLEIMAGLHAEMSGRPDRELMSRGLLARDPLTSWAAETLRRERGLDLEAFLDRALERKYSASPGESFFTGGGLHRFRNFEPDDNGRRIEVRDALVRSTNLVFIRLMRDVVRYHEARLPVDTKAILENPEHPVRRQMLEEIAGAESRGALARAYEMYRGLEPREIAAQLLGKRARSARHLAILFFAWDGGSDEAALGHWLRTWGLSPSARELRRLFEAYSNPRLTLEDYGYLLGAHPLHVWCAGELFHDPSTTWERLTERSGEAERVSSAWLFRTRNRNAQDTRLRIRFEQDAFVRMTPYWRRLGFPFERLVPSYATAIGSSCDRPAALADLAGVLVNGGMRLPLRRVDQVLFGAGTPYHTRMDRMPDAGERVLEPEVARAARRAMAEVVERGTARRTAGAIRLADGEPIAIGGKTGSGDNRFETFSRGGGVTSSRVINRTATFVFYVGDRYFGVVTAFVPGEKADRYRFTSALPVSVFKLLAPSIEKRLRATAPPEAPGPPRGLPA